MKKRQRIWMAFITFFSFTMFIGMGMALAQTTVYFGGQERLYVDTNENGQLDASTDGYFTAYWACTSHPNCGTSTSTYAVFGEGHNGQDWNAPTNRRYIFQIGGPQAGGTYTAVQRASASYTDSGNVVHNMMDPNATADGIGGR